MESAPFKIIIYAKVEKVEWKKRALRSFKTGKKLEDGTIEIKVEYEDLGWFVLLEGSHEALFVGVDKEAPFLPGDTIKITLETEHALPR